MADTKPRLEVMVEKIGLKQLELDGKLDRVLGLLEQLLAAPAPDAAAQTPSAPSQGGPPQGTIAADADLDGAHGNPTVRTDPKRWTGESMVGRTFSDCPADYLDELASLFDWQAGKDEEKGDQRARFKRLDASRARGWAARARAKGKHRTRPAAEWRHEQASRGAAEGPPDL